MDTFFNSPLSFKLSQGSTEILCGRISLTEWIITKAKNARKASGREREIERGGGGGLSWYRVVVKKEDNTKILADAITKLKKLSKLALQFNSVATLGSLIRVQPG